VYICLAPLSDILLVWVGVIAWGSFFHCGGTFQALKISVASNIFGAFLAWIALTIIITQGTPAIVSSIIVGVTVFIFTMAAKIELLSAIPATVYGYGVFVGYSLHHPSAPGEGGQAGTGPLQNLMTINMDNPFVLVVISIVAGGILGYISGQFAGFLTKKEATADA
jgi:Protein of unknown function (DUF1097)